MTPQRIQRKRTRGWRMPEGAVYVGRPSRWGNPWLSTDRARLVELFARDLHYTLIGVRLPDFENRLWDRFRGPDDARLALTELACWCPLVDDRGIHADVLLELANPAVSITDPEGES